MSYTVYVHKTPNGKLYIGITKQSCNIRWNSGKNYKSGRFKSAIKKYGWDNIEHIVLLENLSEEIAYECEKYLISKYNTTDKRYGYNTSIGGDVIWNTGKLMSQEFRQKCREANLGKHHSEETKLKIGEGNKGKYVSNETRKKLSEINKGRILSEESRRKISKAHKGKSLSDEHKAKLSMSLKGRAVSDETKQKIREARLKNPKRYVR